MKHSTPSMALKTSLVLAPLVISSSLLASGLPALRMDESKKAHESGFLYRVIDGRQQAVTLPQIEIDLNEFDSCDGKRDKHCVVFSMANRDALSPLSSEVDRFRVQIQTESGDDTFRFICGTPSINPVPLYNAPNFLKCEFKTVGDIKVSSVREFREQFPRIRQVLPVNFDITFKVVGRKKVTIPARTGEISIDLGKVESFLKTSGASFAYQNHGELFLPRSVALGLIQSAVGYNPCWVGYSMESWKAGASYLKGLTEGTNYNTLLFDSYENQQQLCRNFRENADARGSYRSLLLTIYDRVFTEALEDRGEAGFMIRSGQGRQVHLTVTLSAATEEWQDENRLWETDAQELSSFEIVEDL
jgi:hypothetical protein